MASMDHQAWTFTRRGEILTVRRERTPDGLLLVVDDSGTTRSYIFDDITPLTMFQVELEASLVRNGWSFVAFSAEQREHRLFDHAGMAPRPSGELDADVRGGREH
jgi:hypothetical protein